MERATTRDDDDSSEMPSTSTGSPPPPMKDRGRILPASSQTTSASSQTTSASSQTIILIAAAVGLCLYAHAVPPNSEVGWFSALPVIESLGKDFAQYASRFIASALFLGVLPLLASAGTGYSPASVGLCRPNDRFKRHYWPILIVVGIGFGIVSSLDPAVAAHYPYGQGFPSLARQHGPLVLLVHPFSYFVFYYLPWEFLFRGLLIFPFARPDETGISSGYMWQVIPSALLHFGHPLSEALSAVLFGVLAGWMVYRFRSIVPGLVLHATVGIALDFVLILGPGSR